MCYHANLEHTTTFPQAVEGVELKKFKWEITVLKNKSPVFQAYVLPYFNYVFIRKISCLDSLTAWLVAIWNYIFWTNIISLKWHKRQKRTILFFAYWTNYNFLENSGYSLESTIISIFSIWKTTECFIWILISRFLITVLAFKCKWPKIIWKRCFWRKKTSI